MSEAKFPFLGYVQLKDSDSGYKQPVAASGGVRTAVSMRGTMAITGVTALENVMPIMDRSEYQLRKKQRWVAVGSDADTDTGAYATWIIETPNTATTYKVKFIPQGTGAALYRMRTGTAATPKGTRVAFCNRNLNLATTPGIKLYSGPTIGTSGSVFAKYYIGANYLGENDYWVLAPNATYALEIQSIGDNNVTNMFVEAEAL